MYDFEFDEDTLDVLTGLVNKSLIFVEETDAGPRYRMLETVRDYAASRMRGSPEEAQAQRRGSQGDHRGNSQEVGCL